MLYDKNPDSTNIKRPKWCKGTIKTGKIHTSMKFSLMIQIMLLLGLGDTLKHILLSQGG